jgi:hypothetical protein
MTPPDSEITIRLARPGDLDALRRLVDRDTAGGGTRHMLLDLTRPGTPSRILLAAAHGELLAALHIDSGHGVSDPFASSAAALELLRARAGQIRMTEGTVPARQFRRLGARLRPLRP